MNIRENLSALIAAIEGHPEKRFDLYRFVKHSECGTIYCAAGLAASLPFFQNQMPEAVAFYAEAPSKEACLADEMSDNEDMWGPCPFEALFDTAWAGAYDDEFPQGLTDKQLALARLRLRLKDYPA